MGLKKEYIIIKWHNKNKDWYISKGYEFTKNKKSFKVKIEDISNGCNELIDIFCDECGDDQTPVKWQNYIHNLNRNGKYYCQKCAHNGYKKWVSFYEWCIENNRQDILDRWDYELNKCKPNEITYGTPNKYYFKCPKGLHGSELKNINSFTNGQEGSMDCNKCNSFAQLGIDNVDNDFLNKYWDYNINTVDPWEISKCSRNMVWIKCQEKDYHGSYEINTSNFITQNQRCHYCTNTNGNIHPLDSLGTLHSQVLEIWSDKNIKSPYEYSPKSQQYVWWKCPDGKHEDYYRDIGHSNVCDFRCPECSKERHESVLQEKVRTYLGLLSYTILHERNCTILPKNPKTKTNNNLPFDNEILELKLIIEVHGKQHYKNTVFHILSAKHNNTTPEYELHYQKLKDRYKRIFAKSRGYFYVEIPYWTDNKDEDWKKLINDKINLIITKSLEVK